MLVYGMAFSEHEGKEMQALLQGVLWIIPFIPGSQVTPEEELKPSPGKDDERNINHEENSGADRNKQGKMWEAIPVDTVLSSTQTFP